LVENKKNFDLTKALTLVAEVQPIKIDNDVINEVSIYFRWSLCTMFMNTWFVTTLINFFLGSTICNTETRTTFGMYILDL
jgi:hypothetical protein